MKSRAPVALCMIVAALLGAACDAGPKPGARATEPAATKPVDPGATAPTPPAAAAGDTFGTGVKLTESTPIATILADPKGFAGKTVRTEGMIVDVCSKRGCWFELAGDGPDQKLRFKVQDGVMTFPMSAKGRYALAEGVVAVQDLSLEDSVAYLQELAAERNAPFDPASVTKPISMVRLDGTGAVLRDQR